MLSISITPAKQTLITMNPSPTIRILQLIIKVTVIATVITESVNIAWNGNVVVKVSFTFKVLKLVPWLVDSTAG